MSTNQDNFLATAEAHGGVTRVSFARANSDHDGSHEGHAERMAQVSERVQLLDAKTTYASVNVSGGAEFADNGTILQATSEYGTPMQGGRITEDSFVRLLDVPIRIKDAVSMGLIVKEANGSFRIISAAGAANAEGTSSGKR